MKNLSPCPYECFRGVRMVIKKRKSRQIGVRMSVLPPDKFKKQGNICPQKALGVSANQIRSGDLKVLQDL